MGYMCSACGTGYDWPPNTRNPHTKAACKKQMEERWKNFLAGVRHMRRSMESFEAEWRERFKIAKVS